MMAMLAFILVALLGAASARAQTSPSVALTWTASTSTGVTGHNVYRSQTTGGPYTKIGNAGATVTSYTDATVSAGQTYYYVITAVSSGGESAYSNEAGATIPAPSGGGPSTGDVWYWSGSKWIPKTPSTPVVASGELRVPDGQDEARHTFARPIPTGTACQLVPLDARRANLAGYEYRWNDRELSVRLRRHIGEVSFSFVCAISDN